MVREANVKQAGAEKQLKEAQGKVRTCCSVLTITPLRSVLTNVQPYFLLQSFATKFIFDTFSLPSD